MSAQDPVPPLTGRPDQLHPERWERLKPSEVLIRAKGGLKAVRRDAGASPSAVPTREAVSDLIKLPPCVICPPDVPVIVGDMVTVNYAHQAPIAARVVQVERGVNYDDVGRVTVKVTATSSHYWARASRHELDVDRLTLRRRAS